LPPFKYFFNNMFNFSLFKSSTFSFYNDKSTLNNFLIILSILLILNIFLTFLLTILHDNINKLFIFKHLKFNSFNINVIIFFDLKDCVRLFCWWYCKIYTTLFKVKFDNFIFSKNRKLPFK